MDLCHVPLAPRLGRASLPPLTSMFFSPANPFFPPLAVFFTAALPVLESRAAIPLGLLSFGMPLFEVCLFSFVGNLFPVPFILIGFRKGLDLTEHHIPAFHRWMVRYMEPKRELLQKKYEAQGFLALLLFVALPMPGTGAWTGAALASLFGMRFWKAFLAIAGGVLLAVVAIALATQTGIQVLTQVFLD